MPCATFLAMFVESFVRHVARRLHSVPYPAMVKIVEVKLQKTLLKVESSSTFLYNFNVSQRFWLLQGMLHYAISQATYVGKTL